jgi:eukaryotic-like serine/threonine-protein kinase
VLLSWEGEVKLADFGVAQLIERTMTAGALLPVGKAGYMSPEQVNRQELDGRSDLYAVGVVLWELLAHQRLRVGPPGDLQARISFQDIPRPSVYRPGVPADLEAVAMRLLAYDRWARYQTAELAAQDLVRCQDAPRDGRSELIHLLDERFLRSRRLRPGLFVLELGRPSEGPITVANTSVPTGAPPGLGPGLEPGPERGEPASAPRRAGVLERAWRRWRWALAFGVLLALLLTAMIVLLVAR